jgi:hypothetical protein
MRVANLKSRSARQGGGGEAGRAIECMERKQLKVRYDYN